MTTEHAIAPRCIRCDHVLPRAGAICHVCDVDVHFEGALRTAPPLFTRQQSGVLQPRSGRQAS